MATAVMQRVRVPTGAQLWRVLRGRLDLGLLGLVMLCIPFVPGASFGIFGLGAINGAQLALNAIGLVLILRSSRVINFAQVQLGFLASAVFFEMIRHSQLIVLGNAACGGCVKDLPTDFIYNQSHPLQTLARLAVYHPRLLLVNFWVSAVIALVLGAGLSWLAYRVVLRRFEAQSILMTMVVTIALAPAMIGLATALPGVFQDPQHEAAYTSAQFVLPSWTATLNTVAFHFTDMLTLGVTGSAMVGIALFLRFHHTGRAMRAVADNRSRALTLGVRVSHVSAMSWLLAGTLSTAAGVLTAMQGNVTLSSDTAVFNIEGLVMALVAVSFARFTSIPIAVAVAVGLGALQSVLFGGFNGDLPFILLMTGLLAVGLLLQRRTVSRASREASSFAQTVAREVRPTPRELRSIPSVQRAIIWVRGLVLIAALGLPWFLAPDQVTAATDIVIVTIVGFSLLVLTGWAGQVSLAQFAFAGVGGYITAMLAGDAGVFMPLALLAGGVAGATTAALVGIPALRLGGLHLAVITPAFALVLFTAVLNPTYLGRFLPASLSRPTILGIGFDDDRWLFYLCLVVLVLAFFAIKGLRQSRMGRVLIACRDNEEAGQSFGVSLVRARLIAFAISGFIAAIGGGLLVYQQNGVLATSFSPDQGISIFLVVMIGGLGSVVGPLLGAIYGGILLFVRVPVIAFLGSGLGAIAVLMIYPQGMAGMAFAGRDAWLRRVAMRLRIVVPSLFADTDVNPLDAAAPIAPKVRPTGGTAFVPRRYELANQWSGFTEAPKDG